METAADSPESRYPVRRSGRQAKRTDKLEEFLSSAKRASRKSNPLSLDGGEHLPTDVETASEASLDGNTDFKNDEDKVESPERRTRSSTRKQQQQQQKSQCLRQTRGSSRVTAKDEESSENEEDDKDTAAEDHAGDKKDEDCPVNVGDTKTVQPQADMESSQSTGVEQKNENESDREQMKKEADKDTDQDGSDKTVGGSVKRGPLRTYVNKKKAATKNTSVVKAPASKTTTASKREIRAKSPQGSKKIRTRQRCNDNDDDDEDDEEEEDEEDDDEDSSTSSSSESDSGYDPNALYCICRQKHNKRYFLNKYFTINV